MITFNDTFGCLFRMKYIINKEYELRQISESVFTLESRSKNSKIITLNSSAAYIWENICDTVFRVEDICKLLVEHYHISETDAYNDSKDILDVWCNAAIIIPIN